MKNQILDESKKSWRDTLMKRSLECLKKAFFITIISSISIISIPMLMKSFELDFMFCLGTIILIYTISPILILVYGLSGFTNRIQAIRIKVNLSNDDYLILIGNFFFILLALIVFYRIYLSFLAVKSSS